MNVVPYYLTDSTNPRTLATSIVFHLVSSSHRMSLFAFTIGLCVLFAYLNVSRFVCQFFVSYYSMGKWWLCRALLTSRTSKGICV